MISKNMSMGQAVLEHHQLLPLLARFGITLGFGEKSVEEVCGSHGVNPDFFLEIVNTYLDEEFEPHSDLSHFSLGAVVEYLASTHNYYVEVALPRMESEIHELLERSDLSNEKISLVTEFFNDYKKDFLTHISQEEQEILPYILELEKESVEEHPDPDFLHKLKHSSIGEFAKTHDRLETSLENLSKLIIKYLPPFKDQVLCIQVLKDLAELVKDLVAHADMEDKVLIPRVAELERQLIRKWNNP